MKFRHLPLVLIALALGSLPAEPAQLRVHAFKSLRLFWSDNVALVYKDNSPTARLIFQEYNTYSPFPAAPQRIEYSEEHYKVLSVVGPIFSFASTWHAEGGAHPAYGTIFTAFNLDTGKPDSLLNYFTESQVLSAFLKDSLLKPRIPGKASIRTLADFFKQVDGGCELGIRPSMLESFAFHHLKENNVAVRVGISHGCEVNRGDFHQIGFYLPASAALSVQIREAEIAKTLMKDLAPKEFMK